MDIFYRPRYRVPRCFASAAALTALVILASCSGIPREMRQELERSQQLADQRIQQMHEVQQLTRMGRFGEAQRIAQQIDEQEKARADRCEEAWRQQEEIERLNAQGRYREIEKIQRNRRHINPECSDLARRDGSDRDIEASYVEGRRNEIQYEGVGVRDPLFATPQELYIGDAAPWADWPKEAWELMLQSQAAELAGDLREAEAILVRLLALVEQTRGSGDPSVGFLTNSLSRYAEQRGQLPEALRYVESAIGQVEQRHGKNSKSLSPILQWHAELLIMSGNPRAGLEAGERAFALHANAPASSLERAAALNNLGVVFHHAGDTQRALGAYQQSLDTLRAIGDKATLEDQAMADWEKPSLLSNLGLAHWQQGDTALASQFFGQAQEAMAERDELNGADTETGSLRRASQLAVEFDALISLERARSAKDSSGEFSALTMLFERKGATLDRQKRDMQSFRQEARGDVPSASRSSEDRLRSGVVRLQGLANTGTVIATPQSEDRDLLAEEDAVRAKRAALALQSPATPQEAATQSETAKALDTQIKAIELEKAFQRQQRELLADRAPASNALQQAIAAGRVDEYFAQQRSVERELASKRRRSILADIQARIPANTVLLEMVRYRPLDPRAGLAEARRWGPARYGTYVIQAAGAPRYIDYGEAQAIDQLIGAFRKSLSRPGESEHMVLGRRLDAILLQPVREQIGASSQIWIAPEGMLNLLPFGALVDERNRYLVDTRSFNYLSSGRDLQRQEDVALKSTAPLILADPAFDDGDTQNIPASNLARARRSRDFEGMKFDRLPGAGVEAEIVKKILPDAILLTGPRATETALKKTRGPRILHIATHGFFLEDLNASTDGAAGRQAYLTENPMLRSGLALAGANQLRSASDDGVLTALEAAALDLNGTKLVVLSACETGVGEIKNSEGVFGLRRAFIVAGAETVVMSLWPVADEATKDLMTSYYHRIAQGAGRAEALRQAQLELRSDPKRAHPFYWASFISAGQAGTIK